MKAPICDFVKNYADGGTLRLHMPGHKGRGDVEALDITEINGADSLYCADGIIAQSEANASALFGCPTFYSTEGSSQCIRAMLYLAVCAGDSRRIIAGRNAHRAFVSAAALLDLEVEWLCAGESYLSCLPNGDDVERAILATPEKPAAVYLTSPDYLGNIADIRSAAEVCRKYGVLLLVDNAHGAYLRFLSESRHPIDLGADLCCDSAHKTLPVLTGGAYLHISPERSELFAGRAKDALLLFGSTSPSYLILQSLDRANLCLHDGYAERLAAFIPKADAIKRRLCEYGFELVGSEPLKLTVAPKSFGYTGGELADLLRSRGIECEFADPDFTVAMLSADMTGGELSLLEEALVSLPKRTSVTSRPPEFAAVRQVTTIREAIFAPSEQRPVTQCEGRILASLGVSCPPAVPIVLPGERISATAIDCLAYYGIAACRVVCE
ncbi:MAG: PLP-dependent transferase [Clostridia bacterium]|nr:PLP-dependent transferase [Clostridia bacterium]